MREDPGVAALVEPSHEQVLEFCARDPVERVFLEDVARRDLGRFVATDGAGGALAGLFHVGADNAPPRGGCPPFARAPAARPARVSPRGSPPGAAPSGA